MKRSNHINKAVGYCRVSTEFQVANGVSLDAQNAKIQAWAEANDFQLLGIYIDAGISGYRSDNRPELQTALNEACENHAALIVYSLSRLCRNTKEAIAISERLDKNGADLVSLSEKIDTTSAAGKMVFRILAVLSEFERDLVSERTKAALSYRKAQGKRLGNVPYGFDVDDDGETLLANPAEQKVIRFIRRLRGKGASLRAISDKLYTKGVETKTGNNRWSPKVIAGILKQAR